MQSRCPANPGRQLAVCLLWLVALSPLVTRAQPQAEQRLREFSIEPQPLSGALVLFAQQAGLQLFSGELGDDMRLTRAIRGRYTPRQALELLLGETGLRYELSGSSVLISAPPGGTARAPSTSGPADSSAVAPGPGDVRSLSAAGSSRAAGAASAGSDGREAAPDRRTAAQQQRSLDEIFVTALKRSQSLIDVPLAVSAITGEDIAERGATSFRDLALSVPGVSVIEQGTSRNRVQIRGIANRIGVPPVGYYLDEMGVNTEIDAQLLDIRLIDLARVEVLRGPQGTLYGQGSMGGTIRFITTDPDLSRLQGSAEVEGSTVTDGGAGYRGALVANLPVIADVAGLRIVAAHEQQPGWIDNITTGERDVNDGRISTFRAKGLWKPHADLAASALVLYQESAYDAEPQSTAERTIADALNSYGRDRHAIYNLTLDWNLGVASLLSSSGYLKRRQLQVQSIPAFAPIVSELYGIDAQGYAFPSTWNIDMFTQELRLASTAAVPLTWTAGAFYRDVTQDLTGTEFSVPENLPVSGPSQEGAFLSRSAALFGEAGYEFASGLGLALGLRYFTDRRRFRFNGEQAESGVGTFHTLNPRLSLSWRFSDQVRLYASAAKGFRSGGFNNQVYEAPAQIPPTYDVERLWTYEVGAKAQLADGRLDLEGAVYRNEWSNVIDLTAIFIGDRVRTIRTNAGAASGQGVEAAARWRATRRLTVSAQLNWNDMQYDTTTAAHLAGDPIDSVPAMTAAASLEYRRPLARPAAAELYARLDYQHRDPIEWRRRDLDQDDVSDAYRSLEARIGFRWPRWEVCLAGRNLTDDNGRSFASVGDLVQPLRPQPRTLSLLLRSEF